MAVQVTPARGMNGTSSKIYKDATRYVVDDRGYLDVYRGTKRVATYSPPSWESVGVVDLLDETKKKPKKQVAPQFGLLDPPKAVVKEGSAIRTSPSRGVGDKKGKAKKR